MLPVGERAIRAVAMTTAFASFCIAATVRGDIKIDNRLSKRSMAPARYDLRGMEPNSQEKTPLRRDPFERVAVWLEPESPMAVEAKADTTDAVMQQRNRHFEPSLLVVQPGARVVFPNLDPIFHNIFSFSPTLPFDLGYYTEGKSREVIFPRPGVAQIYCHVHPEMYGVVVVTPSRWAMRPTTDGGFNFVGVPPGRYRALLWQRSAGFVRKSLVVSDRGDARISFIVPEDQDR